jgi:hypothetical protein
MPKKHKNPSKSRGFNLWIVAILGISAVVAVALFLNRPKALVEPEHSVTPPEVSANVKPTPNQSVSVLKPVYNDGKLTFRKTTEEAPGNIAPQIYAINSFLAGTGIVSPDAKLESIEVKNGVAILKFSKAFESTYGTEDERTVVEGVLRTLGQYPEIKKAKFQIGDHDLETLGNIELIEPMPVIRSKRK